MQDEADAKLDQMIKEYERRPHEPPPEEEYEVPFAG